jgi:hypothetical protein
MKIIRLFARLFGRPRPPSPPEPARQIEFQKLSFRPMPGNAARTFRSRPVRGNAA